MSVEKHCEIAEPQNFDYFLAGGVTMAFERPGLYAYISFEKKVDFSDLLLNGRVKITPEGIIIIQYQKPIEAHILLWSSRLSHLSESLFIEICSRYCAHSFTREAFPLCQGRLLWNYSIASKAPEAQQLAPCENAEGAADFACDYEPVSMS